jgi:hypothetical protein
MSRDNLLDPTDAAVHCKGKCGLVFLTDEQYDAQMDRPDSTWTCPQCGGGAEWDDDCRSTNPPDDDV